MIGTHELCFRDGTCEKFTGIHICRQNPISFASTQHLDHEIVREEDATMAAKDHKSVAAAREKLGFSHSRQNCRFVFLSFWHFCYIVQFCHVD